VHIAYINTVHISRPKTWSKLVNIKCKQETCLLFKCVVNLIAQYIISL